MAKRTLNRLTARTVETLKAPGWHADGGGLYLRIDGDGRKRWVLVYFSSKRRREMGLGAATGAGAVSLTDAREAARRAQGQARTGIDPVVDREATKAAEAALEAALTRAAAMPTFGAFADEYIEAMRPSWRNAKHVAQWRMTLGRYCMSI